MIGWAASELAAKRDDAVELVDELLRVKPDNLGKAPFGKMPGMAAVSIVR